MTESSTQLRRRILALQDLPEDVETRDIDYLPTPDEIKTACKELQKSWSKYERYRRANGIVHDTANILNESWRYRWTPPRVRVGH